MSIDTDYPIDTILIVVIFMAAFVIIGVLAPTLYYRHAPMDRFIEVHEFSAEDTHTNATEHQILFSRTVNHPFRGDVLIETRLISEGSEMQANVIHERSYFERGNRTIILERTLPPHLEAGRYYYRMHIRVLLPSTERDMTVRSNTFQILNASEMNASETGVESERIRLSN